MRAPYQVLIFLYKKVDEEFLYAIFKREDLSFWQAIAGGGEEGETLIETAKRETFEETGREVLDPFFSELGHYYGNEVAKQQWFSKRKIIPCYLDKDTCLKLPEIINDNFQTFEKSEEDTEADIDRAIISLKRVYKKTYEAGEYEKLTPKSLSSVASSSFSFSFLGSSCCVSSCSGVSSFSVLSIFS